MYKQLITADTLSCCHVQVYPHPESEISAEADWYVKEVVYHLPATEKRFKEIKEHQDVNPVCKLVKHDYYIPEQMTD